MLSSKAMLVDLNIGVWTARKLDRGVSTQVDVDHATQTRAGNYHKNLLAGSDKLGGIRTLAGEIRTYHYTNTLPWSDSGTRILPATKFIEYNSRMGEYKAKFDELVQEFIHDYPNIVSAAAFVMGSLFNRGDYPTPDVVAAKFRMEYTYAPIPDAGDFRVDIETEALNALASKYKNTQETQTKQAISDVWQRMQDMLVRISSQVDFTDDNRKRIYSTMLTSAQELCELVPHLNITNDLRIESARAALVTALDGVTTEDIKDSQQVRDDLKAKVDEISNMLAI